VVTFQSGPGRAIVIESGQGNQSQPQLHRFLQGQNHTRTGL